MSNPQQVGFVYPNAPESNQYQAYPPTQQPHYPNNPPHQNYPPPNYNQQPFPPPILHQPGFGQASRPGTTSWYHDATFDSYMRAASSFHVKQKVEVLEAIVGWEQANKYSVKDQNGNKLFTVLEESDCLMRQCCNAARPFTLLLKDYRDSNILRIERSLNCSCCCGAICPDSVAVSSESGVVLGYVKQEFSILRPRFKIKDATGKTVLRIEGPWCPCSYRCMQVVFRVLTLDGVSVGHISKQWGGLVRELLTDADSFNIVFPIDLDPSIKAVCLAALFLVDFEYFEHGSKSTGRDFVTNLLR